MDDFSLYITVPGRKNRKAAEGKLTDVLGKTEEPAVRLTWIAEGRQAGFSAIRRIIRYLGRMEKKPGERVLINTVEFGSCPKGFLPLRALSRYRFRIAFRPASPGEAEKCFRLAKKLARHNISHVVHDPDPSDSAWRSWLGSGEYRPAEPFLDYVKILEGGGPLSCRYRSCLGRTLALDAAGRWSICPYHGNTVRIHDPADCETLSEAFQTEEFAALLEKQIEVRERCAAGCPYYPGCRGGCPLSAGEPCPEPDLLRALRSAEETGLPPAHPAVREERLNRLAGTFTV